MQKWCAGEHAWCARCAGDVKEFGFRELPGRDAAGPRGAARAVQHKSEPKEEPPPGESLPQLQPVPLAVDGEADPRLAIMFEPMLGVTFTPTRISASEKINVIPSRAELNRCQNAR